MAAHRVADAYAGHDPANTARFAGLVWLVYGVAVLAVLPVASGGRPAAIVAGAVLGLTAAIGGRFLVRGWVPRYEAMLAFSYAGTIALLGLQLLLVPARGALVLELYLLIALQTASVHPPRRTAGVLIAIAGAYAIHVTRGGWSGTGAADFAMHTGVWLLVALIANSLVLQLRQQRAAARAEEAEAQRLASTDALTGLGNRRRLLCDLDAALAERTPFVLALFDLDGFKAYNDSFGHPAGDALLRKLGSDLARTLEGRGDAYRMGGDEFCVLAPATHGQEAVVLDAAGALTDRGGAFSIGASYGSIVLPAEAASSEQALRIADRRMYANKACGRTSAGRQSTDVLLRVLREGHPDISDHLEDVTRLCEDVAERLEVPADVLAALLQAANLHDIGKAAIPDAILAKPEPLDADDWAFMRQHPLMGERIMSAAPSLSNAAQLVRWSHERLDGTGYPDGLRGDEIPLGARIIAVCDAFDAMVSERPYSRAMTTDEALAELRRCAGSQFDPDVVEALCATVTERLSGPARRAVNR